MISDLLLTAFLVFLNGFFVAAEFAIVKVRSSQIHMRSASSAIARIAESVISHLDSYLAATQLGITLASLGLGWIGEPVVGSLILKLMNQLGIESDPAVAHRLALPIAFVTITVLHIVFGELAPKSIAIRYPTRTTLWVALPLKFFYYLFRPFIWLLNGLANLILRLVGIQLVAHSEAHSEEELKLIISESAESGAIQPSERELIQNVFTFDERLVKHIMTPRTQVIGMHMDTPLAQAVSFALKEGYSRYPVYEDSLDQIAGFVHTKDLLVAQLEASHKTLRDLMRPVLFTHPNKRIVQLLRQFQRNRLQLAVVTNEFGSTTGIVTMEDILEELVGEIQDEYDQEQPPVIRLNENTWRILAQTNLERINEYLPEPFPLDEDYDTLAGLLLKVLEKIPQEGSTIPVGNYEVVVLKMYKTSPEIVEVRWKATQSSNPKL
ncbi:MAG: hemolysin family protein [Saprospiraceae bacterium]|nr:hemolysin family protein [Saprospiraceae bacterium]MDW8484909.1 hemolysin family protein [Saprospiraceae bacterium]